MSCSSSQVGTILPGEVILTMSGDDLGSQTWGGSAASIKWAEELCVCQNASQYMGQPLTKKTYPNPTLELQSEEEQIQKYAEVELND